MKIISTQIQSMRFCDSQHVLRGNRLQSEEGGGSHWGNNENNVSWDFPGDPVVKTPLANAMAPHFLPGKSHGQRSLVGCSPWGRWGSDTTERLHFHFSLSWIGEGNGNPLQCSCLENPRDRKPGWLPSMGSHRVRHYWSDLAAAAAAAIV